MTGRFRHRSACHEIRPAGLCPAGRTDPIAQAEGSPVDALGVYLDGAAEVTGRKILVVFTDGDTCARFASATAMTLIALDVVVYAIGFLQNQSVDRDPISAWLTQMATESGGSAFFPTTMKEIEEA